MNRFSYIYVASTYMSRVAVCLGGKCIRRSIVRHCSLVQTLLYFRANWTLWEIEWAIPKRRRENFTVRLYTPRCGAARKALSSLGERGQRENRKRNETRRGHERGMLAREQSFILLFFSGIYRLAALQSADRQSTNGSPFVFPNVFHSTDSDQQSLSLYTLPCISLCIVYS